MRLIFLCLFIPTLCFSQQTINARQFFAVGLSGSEQFENTDTEKVEFPWIEQYEFRTETRDFDLVKQEYTFRLSPSTAKIRNAQKALYEEIRNAPDFEGQKNRCDLFLSLHIDWLSLFILNEHKDIMDEWVDILNDKQMIYERAVGTLEFDPQKLFSIQTEKNDLEIERNKVKLKWEYLLDKYNIQDREIDFGNFTTIEAISDYLIHTLLPSKEATQFVDKETEYQKQLLTKEIELESSEKKQFVDFVQLRYNGPHSDLLQERLSLGLGFQLSTSGNRKLKIQELKIEQEELDRKAEREIVEKQEELNTLENKLKNDIEAFFHFQKVMKEERTNLKNLGDWTAQKEGTSPLLLLDIEERHLSMRIKLLDQKEELLKDYLNYLFKSDRMCQSDFVNYLSP